MNRLMRIAVILLTALNTVTGYAGHSSKPILWYDRPGDQWSESLPIGNGRMGAMMHGDPAQDLFYLNEETIWSGGPHDYTNMGSYEGTSSTRNGIIGAIRFRSEVHVTTQGGSVSIKDNRLCIDCADSATLLLVCATNHVNYKDVSANPDARCATYLAQAQNQSFAKIKRRHMADHSALFGRVQLDLGATEADLTMPTDRLLQNVITGKHSALLEEQLFQFARYLTIAGARPGTQPLNLVGIWAENLGAPWGGKWTLNINAELNTWPVETTNLAECHQPLLALLEDLRVTGRKTAREHYRCGGFVAHHNTDFWRGAAPVDTAIHGLWPMGGAWLCRHIWEHYDFSRDVDYLRQYYPTMKEAAEFFVDYLTLDRDGYLSTCPAISFEQTFVLPNGTQGRLTYGPTMDNQILCDLFDNCIAASEHLNTDVEFREQSKGRIRSRHHLEGRLFAGGNRALAKGSVTEHHLQR